MKMCFDFNLSWTLHDPRADRDVAPFLDGHEQLRNLVQRSRSVGVHEQDDAASRIQYPHADGRPFAHVRTGQNTDADIALLEDSSQREGLVSASVVGDDEFEIKVPGRTPTDGLEYRPGQACLLVVRGNDDRQLDL